MRLWSIHPCNLDSRGLVALWREGLLAQKVLQGNTRGYRNHPQLIRFKAAINPVGAIAAYLKHIADEADKRGYHFDRSKITNSAFDDRIPVTTGQLEYEFLHLLGKLKQRNTELYIKLNKTKTIKPHPIFNAVIGDIEDWEVF
ncbi:MAG TPA: pyrimidine dimer DNA glycosylase/endonuclease V [Desulfobacteraceae bacterium]|nr:pyrimidine dimer DNA glycosylase/endonuclease V [Desulfobacteraceae bacterium]HPJ66477.1 pyrimidine dimer DNA glycosylase/endonuclease V [Desulfobacteraceae bacterium]